MYEIADDSFVMQRAEPPSKPAGSTEEPNMGEEEGKAKELAEAANESAAMDAQKASDAVKASAKAAVDGAAAAAAKAAKDKAEDDFKNLRLDGNIHKNGQRIFADGAGVVGGVNDYAQI